jgi:hypothetical protein
MFAAKNELFTRPNGGYNLTRSLRLRSSASAYLNRTPATASNRTTWTWSGWIKRGALGTTMQLFGADSTTGGGSVPRTQLQITSSDQLDFSNNATGSSWVDLISTPVYRDPSAWYHVVCAIDTTQATAANRVKLYINGSQITAFGTSGYPAQNDNTAINTTGPHNIGRYQNNATQYFDGYLTEIYFVDGQALTPSSFGAFSIYNQWLPKKYAGTYGNNGFYLPFTNNASAATLGNDFSGNGNTWTTNNISVTAGTTYDSMTDVPTLTSATAANFAVFGTPYSEMSVGSITDGNLAISTYGGTSQKRSSFAVTSGKFYWEITITGGVDPTSGTIGITDPAKPNTTTMFAGSSTGVIAYYGNGNKYVNGAAAAAYGSSYTTSDVIGVALDMDGSTITFYKNNTSQGSISTTGTLTTAMPLLGSGSGSQTTNFAANFGQRPFTYTPPSGFVALNTFNL